MPNATRPPATEARTSIALQLIGQAVRGAFTGASRAITERLIKLLSE
ncbi:hypothetical protein [Kitasatospora sp. NPDC006786]